ncbi:hypothetical protein F7725_019994 [Dissostichus mawsoni]|uniref:Uncharacterized protein n=1 Tax=Dissostichus mawsoni TaxID=36200 RepID=A0A7J5YLE1_DISMA|nr:hypothetical protein F7725_019994 [Dissostichus mawsoni]
MGILDIFLQASSTSSLLMALVVLICFYILFSSSFSSQDEGKEPPGPKPLPFLGNLLQLDLRRPYHTLMEVKQCRKTSYCRLSRKYGSVFTVYMGTKKVVVLAGYKTVKEALVNHAQEFGDRDPIHIFQEYNQGHGITWANGESWKEMRRFALTSLRDFGMGKKASEDKIIEECNQLIGVLKQFKGEAFDMTTPLFCAVCNIICSMVYGIRFEYDDPEFRSLLEDMSRRGQLLGTISMQVYNMFPRFFKWIGNRKLFFRLGAANRKQNLKIISHLKETHIPQMCRGFVDAFLVRKQNHEKSGITYSHFHNDNLMATVFNLFAAGTDTTSATLRWALLLVTKYPKIQDQVQEELSRVIGHRQVQIQDRKNLHFVNAVLHETQRLANIAPMSLPHKTSQDVTFQGHFIKKGTTVTPLLMSVLYDESEWENPHSFYPAHFLDKDGQFVKRDAFMPFSAGLRACPGESLAKMELFFFFTSLLQYFRFTPAPGVSEDELDLTPCMRLTLDPASSTSSLLGALVVLVLVYIVSSSSFGSQDEGKGPPGPKPLPLLGNLLQLDLVLWSNGASWKEMRRFALTNLRDFGMGKRASEDKIIEECDHLIEVFKKCKGEAFDTTQPINYAESGVTDSNFHDKNLMQTVLNLFNAGTDTTATTLRWGLLFMAKYPKIQDKVKEELSRVIGSRQAQAEDRKSLPFTDAVIHETQRLANIVPMALPHKTSQDVTFQGHFIKKGTTVYPLLTSVLYDESEWEHPLSFYPAHFLDKDGKFIKRDAFMPFSAGRRVCLGESLARMELFIFFTSLLQHFRFTPAPGVSEDELDLTPGVGFTLSPSPHKLSISLFGALVVLLLVYIFSSSFSSQDEGKGPPGPKPLPLLGNLLQLDLKRPYQTFMELSKKYGSVFTVHLGPQKVVILAGYKTVKEALVNYADEFGDRYSMQITKETSGGHGLARSNGESWREMRRFTLTNLRDFGMGKRACEDKIIEECTYLIDVLKKCKGEAFDTTQPIYQAVSNMICSIVYGSRFEYDDAEFTSLVFNMFPWIGKWIADRKELHRIVAEDKKQNQQLFSRLKETLNPQMCRGFVDAFLLRKQNLEESGITDSHFHDKNLMQTVLNLFAAGTDTTATTLRWALLFMAKYPKIQDQVQEELSRVIGSRQAQVEDRKSLPFTDAVIHETQRLGNIAPLALPHKTSQDVTFQGHFIKKVRMNEKRDHSVSSLTSVLYDESEWEHARSFYPAHFLDKDGKFIKPDAFMPFSAGRRVCIGESLARMELFIFFTSLLQHFRFTPAPGVSEDELDLTPGVGFTLSPSPHKLCAVSCISISLFGALVVLLLVYIFSSSFSSQDEGKGPPGPKPLPLLGNLLQLDLKRPYQHLWRGVMFYLSKKYGSVFTVHLGPQKVVILAGYKTVKEALVNYADEFGDRYSMQITKETSGGHGLIWSNGESWREMRRFAMTSLRDFGMGKRASEDKIIEECTYLIDVLKKCKGEAFDTTQPIYQAVANMICSIVYGSRFEYDDAEFTSLVFNMFPWIGKWIADRKELHTIIAESKKRNQQLFSRLKETLNPQMCRGLVDAFLLRKLNLEESGITDSHFHDKNLIQTVLNLFTAGTDTTATTLRWALLYMAKNPKIQGKELRILTIFKNSPGNNMCSPTKENNLNGHKNLVQEELSKVKGGRQVQVEDRQHLHFTNAVIHEIQRLANIVPMALPHKMSQDITFQGHFIKKGTTVYPLLTSVLCDETEWEHPSSFYPAHFLDKDGKFVKRDAFLPFSAGRRQCPGESLARMEIFLFFTSLLQHFRFTPPPGVSEDELDLTPIVSFAVSPSPHKLCAVPVVSISLIGALVVLLLVYILSSSSFSSQDEGKGPPGPKPLPLLGNLLQLDLKRPYQTFMELSKKYGSVFTVHLGPQKVVILAGYKTVKEALVNYADEFGDRYSMQITKETSGGHGLARSNGESWREMRRFTLTNLRDFGMGKRACEDKIIEECTYLIDVLKKCKGEAFDTTQPIYQAVANMICSIVYGSRFEYDDAEFTSLVFNMFPWIGKWIADRKELHRIVAEDNKQNHRLKETLNPQMCRGFVDAFLLRKQNLEESGITDSHFHDKNLMQTVLNLFAAALTQQQLH